MVWRKTNAGGGGVGGGHKWWVVEMVVVGIYEEGPLLEMASVMPHPLASLLFISGLFDQDLVDEEHNDVYDEDRLH